MRLDGLDIARYLVFCGMVLVNFVISAGVEGQPGLTTTLAELTQGRAAALFVILAGIGITLGRVTARVMLIRAALLFVLGLLNMIVFDADILHFYALYFVCAAPLLGVSQRNLLWLIVAVTVIAYVALFAFDYEKGWDWETYHYTDLWTLKGFVRHMFYNGWHPLFPWFSFVLWGMWLGRQHLGEMRVQRALFLGGAAVSVITALCSRGLATLDPALAEVVGTGPVPPTPFYILAGGGAASAALGASLWIAPRLMRFAIGRAMALAGQQALTLYVAHVNVGILGMFALGLANGQVSADVIGLYALGFCLLSLIYATLWHRRFGTGPFEVLMRRATRRDKSTCPPR